MSYKKGQINSNLEKQIRKTYYQLIADLNTPSEAKIFFEDFLSTKEMAKITKRLTILYLLKSGRGTNNIADNLKISSKTVNEVAAYLKKSGIKLAFDKIEADEWASKWGKKISKILHPKKQ